MDITQLEYFKSIAENNSLTKAAKEHHISQPAMSAMLKKFEEELEVELFDRSANRIQLNELGEAALTHVTTILQEVESMKKDLRNLAKQKLTLTLGFCDPGVQWYYVPRFSYAHPEIELSWGLYLDKLKEGESIEKLLKERIYDALITPEKVIAPGIVSVPFIKDRVYLCVTPDNRLYEKESVSIREIPAQPLLIPDIGGYFIEETEKILAKENPKVELVKNDYLLIQHLIRTTNFLATVSELSKELRNDGENRKLVPVNDPELNKVYHLTYSRENKKKIGEICKF